MSYGVRGRCSLDLALLWLWRRPVAVGPIRPLAWELPYAVRAALKRQKTHKKEKKKDHEELQSITVGNPEIPDNVKQYICNKTSLRWLL